jgi:hypothetical protein
MEAAAMLCCPVCRAKFRDASTCSRCGADLAPLMTRLARAWALRQRARHAARLGQYPRAVSLATAADDLCRTQTSKQLLYVTEILDRVTNRSPSP